MELICQETNPERIDEGIPEGLAGADVCIAFSTPGPNVIAPEAVRSTGSDAVVLACANPIPEILPAHGHRGWHPLGCNRAQRPA